MISIIGGTYYENCQFPYWDELYGSGLRACIAIREMCDAIHFHSCYPKASEQSLISRLKSNKIDYTIYPTEQVIEFYYLHGLSAPRINNVPSGIKAQQEVAGDNLLLFGMLEIDMIVKGKKVVYDPQSPLKPIPFHNNGSKADELALVLNSFEAISLSGKAKIEEAGKKLLETANVVIIKEGFRGARVFTESITEQIPAYKTNNVFSIGSGDIFSAVFSYFWMEENIDPVKAAHLASKASACYCNSKTLPIKRKNIEIDFSFDPIKFNGSNEKKYDIYLAGPFFTVSEYWLINDLRSCFQNMGFNVFSPIHDVGSGDSNTIANKDIDALKESKIVYANLDGLDTGTIFEIGYANALGIPVIVYSTLPLNHNSTMLEGMNCSIFKDITTSLYKTAWSIIEN